MASFRRKTNNPVAAVVSEQVAPGKITLNLTQIPPLHEEAALKFVRLALSCCHEKRKERPKMAVTLSELNDLDRTVAVASGREPEDSMPSFGRLPVLSLNFIANLPS